MAIKIENQNSANDVFKVTCPSCGRALSYERKDIRFHRRWPNGFIYCPGCKAPIGHNEANLFKTGKEIEAKRKAQEEERRQAEIERRNNYLSDNERLKKDINRYKQNKKTYLITGITTMVIGIIILAVSVGLATIESFYGSDSLHTIVGVGVLITMLGVFLLIMGSVYNTKIKNLEIQIKKNEQNEKDSN